MMEKKNALLRSCSLVLATLLLAGLVSCAQNNQSSDQNQTSSSGVEQVQVAHELYGSPWVTSIFAGNLPDAAPEAADDLYLHYDYEYIADHQNSAYASVLNDAQAELPNAVIKAIKDESLTSTEMDQLRIFYGQAADLDALEAAGLNELMPYLKAVADTQSLDELEALLVSDGFPFSPWIETTVSAADMKSNMCVAVMPNMLFSDAGSGTETYQDSDDEHIRFAYELMRWQKALFVKADLMLLSIEEDEERAKELANSLFELEKRYGKDENQKRYQDADYGAMTQAIKTMTFDELASACPNFPMRETLAKLGEDVGDTVIVMYPEWLASFNDVWTEENFELLRTMTEVKVLRECSSFIAPSLYANARVAAGQGDPTADGFAYSACDKTGTFSQLLAKIYVEQELGEQTVEELEKLTNDLIDEYIELVDDTPWLDAQSREMIMDKIDNMALNILYPDGGYFDYSGLKLVPTEEGGTLLGNYLKLKAYNDAQEAAMIGKPASASATWLYIQPTTQNCFYDLVSNSMNIFPGYVTSAIYSKGMEPEELLAGIGFAIGHEISHAFDYAGSQFNAYGEPVSVFNDADVQTFVAKRQEIADYYSTIEVMSGITIDGKAKSAEATADLSGLQVVLEKARDIEGFDFEKMFGRFAYKWATVYSTYYADLLLIDSHALNNARVNVNAQMFDTFYETYDVSEGNAMYLAPEKRFVMWGSNSGGNYAQ